MKPSRSALAMLSMLLIAGVCASQTTPATARAELIANKLRILLEPVGVFVDSSSLTHTPGQARKFHLQWQKASTSRGGPAESRLSVVGHTDAGAMPRQRSLDLGPGTLLVVALDASGKLRCWQTITDPRFLRSEVPGPDGVLTGTTVPNPSADFRVFVPNNPEIVELRLYEPHQAADGNLALGLVETVRLP